MSRKRKTTKVWLPWELINSKAFENLKGKAPHVLLLFYARQIPTKTGPKTFRMVNEGKIMFTYNQALKDHSITSYQFASALTQLMKYGFIDRTRVGGASKGNFAQYAISDRWRKWGKRDFVNKDRFKDFRLKRYREGATPTRNPEGQFQEVHETSTSKDKVQHDDTATNE